MPSPSKDPRDYRTGEERRPGEPRRKSFLFADSGVPLIYHFFAGTCSVFAVLAITDNLVAALAGGLAAQVIVDLMGHAERLRPPDA